MALELHDSEVSSVAVSSDSTVIHLSKAYVHASEGTPGVSAGDGFLHEAELSFERASATPAHDGLVRVGSTRHSLLDLPFQASGEIELKLQFTSGAVLRFQARGVRCVVREPGRWLEKYPG